MSARDQAIRLLAGTSATGRAFLETAAEAVALGLGVPWAGFARANAKPGENEILVLWSHGKLARPLFYETADSPCETLYLGARSTPYHFCPEGVARRFSNPAFLKELGAESYRGEAILDGRGEVLGHVFALSDRPDSDDPDARAFFRLVAQRAGSEYKRLLIEQARQQRELGDRSIIENLPDLVCRFQPDGTLTYVNGAYCRFFGRQVDELLGRSFFELIPEEDHAGARAHLATITLEKPEASYEHQVIAPGGEIRWQSWTDRGIFGYDGRLLEIYSIGRDITEQRRAVQALRESEEFVRLTTDMVPALIAYVDPDLRYRFVNKAYEDWFGLSREAVIGMTLPELLGDAAFENVRSSIQRVLAGDAFTTEYRVHYAHAGERSIRAHYAPHFAGGDKPVGYVALVQDISEEKRAEEALRESEALIRSITDVVPALIADIGPDLRYRFVNAAYAEWFGKSRAKVLGSSVIENIGTERFALARPRVDEALAGREVNFETTFPHAGGEDRQVRVQFRPRFANDGKPDGFVGYAQDISEEKRAEEAIRESEELIRSTTDMVPALIAHIGPDLRYRFVNEAYSDWFGQARDEIIGRRVPDVVGEDKFSDLQHHIEQALTGQAVSHEMSLRHRLAGLRQVRVQYRPRFTKSGTTDGFVALIQDISDQKQTERELQDAKEIAERTNAAKTRFLAAASHDLRQPLHALKLLLAALPETSDETRRREIAARMATGVESMGSMLNALLDVSELEAGAIEPEITDFPINGLFDLVASSVAPQARAKDLDLRIIRSSASLRSDPALLARVVENFLTNAVRYTECGKILIGCRRRNGAVRIEVWDSGIGIPQHQFADIFEEFRQLDNPGRDRSKGLGLGLAIAGRMAEMLHHPIDVRSTLHKGSMFAIEVPLGEARAEKPAKAPGLARNKASLKGANILIVENDLEVLEATTELLSDWGAHAIPAMSFEEAIQEAGGESVPDLVIADYRLTDRQTGLDAIQRVREMHAAAIPAVILTGDTAPALLKEIESSGNAVLIKPVAAERLLTLIGQLLDRAAPAA